MLNVYEQVDSNKRKSLLILIVFALLVSGFIGLLGYVLGTDSGVIVLALIVSLGSSLSSYWWSDKLVLTMSQAHPADKKDYLDFYRAAENLALASQIPIPRLYVIDSPAMNAFATGRDPQKAVICATTGLLQKLDKGEIEAVVAHEMSHVINYDTRLMTIVAVLVGTITLATNWLLRSRWTGDRKNKKAGPILFLIAIVSMIVTPIAAKLIQLAISRRREYLADAQAVKLTRQPENLIRALKQLAGDPNTLTQANSATAHLYIHNPFGKLSEKNNKMLALFATHPPIQDRILQLEKML
ncbi:MAG: M48 family metalloprotease [Patescibacteria group bacterium]